MKRKWTLGNIAQIAALLVGLAGGNFARAQVDPGMTPTPAAQDLHYLNQAPPGGVPLESATATPMPYADALSVAVPANENAMHSDVLHGNAPLQITTGEPSEEDILAAIGVLPCDAVTTIDCNRIYIPVMVRESENAPSEAEVLSWRATVIAFATRIAQQPRTPTPTRPRPTATAIRPTATATRPGATPTSGPAATATPRPASTATTAPNPVATSTGVPAGNCLNCVDPKVIVPVPNPAPNVSGQMCPAWAHDLWVVTGPNGKLYRTWHPATQPTGMAGTGCNFDHSHGTQRDPRQSAAENTLPAYGYDADLHGMAEPHAGFKTEWANKGDCNTLEGFCSTSDLKLTVHMGTAGAGRLTLEMHTFIFDMVGDRGSIVHVRGMASTGDAITQCDPIPDVSGARGFRMIGMPKDQANACEISSPYEVWQFHLAVGNNIIVSKFATFDGVTVGRRQANRSLVLESTGQTWPYAPYSGCQHDVYFGGFTLRNNVDGPDMHGVRQYIKLGADNGSVTLDTVGKNVYKRAFDGCGPVSYAVN